jgi:hypothetical protein
MKKYQYTVTLTSEAGSPYPIAQNHNDARFVAIAQAKEWAEEHPDKLVFISFFRSQDNQHGYINRDGVDITGKSWTDLE